MPKWQVLCGMLAKTHIAITAFVYLCAFEEGSPVWYPGPSAENAELAQVRKVAGAGIN